MHYEFIHKLTIFRDQKIKVLTMKTLRNIIRGNWHLFTSGLVGAIAFLCIFSAEPLRVTGIGWTLHGYDNSDITQHQTGWMFYRNSPWSFPLFKALNLGYPEGTSISYMDSIPLVALFFKTLSPILPQKFQYFGIYTCLCFILQGVFASALLYTFTQNKLFSCIGSIIFIFSSSFLERCFRHTALSSYWLLLAGLFLYFTRKKNTTNYHYHILWSILLIIAIGIHPYLFAMDYALFLLSEVDCFLKEHSWKKIISGFFFCTLSIVFFGFIFGLFGNSVKSDKGFGIYSLNLNSLFNPEGKYHNIWSSFIKNRPLYSSQGDGIYYLGFPLLITTIITLIIILIADPGYIKKGIHDYYLLIILLGLFTIFALSNVIAFDEKVILIIPIPDKILEIFNMFRTSERFFLIPYYCIMLMSLINLFKIFSSKIHFAIIFCIIITFLQIYEIRPGLRDLHYNFETRKIGIRFSEQWDNLAKKYNTALAFDTIYNSDFSFWLAQNGFRTNIAVTADIHRKKYWERTMDAREDLKNSLEKGSLVLDPKTIYIIEGNPNDKNMIKTKIDLLFYLNNIKKNYKNTAKLRYLGYKKNNITTFYWVLCPD